MKARQREALAQIAGLVWGAKAPIELQGNEHRDKKINEVVVYQYLPDFDSIGDPILYPTPRLRILTGAGVDTLEPPAPELAILKGRARGLTWYAGCNPLNHAPPYRFPALVWVAYRGSIDALLTPKRIPTIVDNLTSLATRGNIYEGLDYDKTEANTWLVDWAEKVQGRKIEDLQNAGRAYFDSVAGIGQVKQQPKQTAQVGSPQENWSVEWPALKAMGVLSTADRQGSVSSWDRNRRHKKADQNPILAGGLKNTTVRVYWGGKQTGSKNVHTLSQPGSKEELHTFLQSAFGGMGFVSLLGLEFLRHQKGKERFTIKFSELSTLVFGEHSNSKQRQNLWETLQALDKTTVVMETQNKGGGLSEWRIYPLTFYGLEWRDEDKQKPPTTIHLQGFDAGTSKNSGFVPIPESVFSLNQKDYALLSYLIIEDKHARAGYPAKVDLKNAIRAGGLEETYRNNPKRGRQKIKEKITRLSTTGLVGEFVTFDGQYIIVSNTESTNVIEGKKTR